MVAIGQCPTARDRSVSAELKQLKQLCVHGCGKKARNDTNRQLLAVRKRCEKRGCVIFCRLKAWRNEWQSMRLLTTRSR